MPRPLRLLRPSPVVVLADATLVATDASQGSHFRLTTGASRTISAPTNPTDGQRAIWEIVATAAITPILATGGAGTFAFGTGFTALPAMASGTKMYVGAIYNAASNRWHVLSAAGGFV